ncbi:MAG: ribonuclease III [Paludibacter sp.]|jgi:ribonuclease-3|nr:ribonuclease III [Paludibacter sp.]
MLKNSFLRPVKSLFRSRKGDYLTFRKVLGFTPDNLAYYQLAIHHRSLNVDKRKKDSEVSNERLEFLGDALLSLIVADTLFKRYPAQSEGFLTTARSRIVKRDSLNRISHQLGIDKLVHTSKGVKKNLNQNILGNTLEAIVAAVYLDLGYEQCVRFVANKMLKLIDIDKLMEVEVNYKSKLIEWCQHNRLTLQFDLVADEIHRGNQHVFRTELTIGEKVICQAEGKSKKYAEQNAAHRALELIDTNSEYFDELIENGGLKL